MRLAPSFKLRPVLAAITALSLTLQPLQPVWAANHPNSSITDTRVVNLTANVDWDYDGAAPAQAGTGGASVILTKEVLRNQILREVARSVFLMTEGRHRIGTVYLYKNGRFGKNVDVQIINKNDRSYANGATWMQPGGSSYNFLAISGNADKLINYSRVIAHELGHYVYGFADEYREDGSAAVGADPGSPAGADYTRNTIMHDHESFTRLSLAEDYANGNATSNNNAQARVYATDRTNLRGGSHWEMLTRDPANDPDTARAYHGGNRIWFDAFKGVTPPATVASLTRYFGVFCDPEGTRVVCGASGTGDAVRDQVVPAADRITTQAAYNARLYDKSGGVGGVDAVDGTAGSAFESFKVLFVDSPNPTATAAAPNLMHALSTITGATTGATTVATAAAGADGSARRRLTATAAETSAAANRHVLVIDRTLPAAAFAEAKVVAEALLELARPGSLWAVVASPATGSTPVAALKSIDTDRAALLAAVRALARQDGSFDAAAAFTQAQAEIASGRGAADSARVELITAAGTTLPPALGSAARQARTAINAIGLRLAGGAKAATVSGGVTLEALAQASGGSANNARNAEHAIKEALRAESKAAGEVFGVLATSISDTLPAGTQATAFNVTTHDKVVSAYWNFDAADKAKLSFRLVTPAGTFTTLSPDSNLDDGYALIEVDNSAGTHNGAARAEVVATAAVSNPVAVDVQAESEVEMVVDLEGGALSDNRVPVLRVQLTGRAPVSKANVLATVYRASDGVAVLTDLPLADDGKGVDARADDGRYALSLNNLLEAGDYTIVVRAVSTASSVFQPNQVFAIGAPVPVRPVGAGLTRVDETDITLEAGALGVKAAAVVPPSAGSGSADGGGGGCTVIDGQRDAGLVFLLGAALLGLWLRRTRNRAA